MTGVALRAAARHPVGLRLWLADVPQHARMVALPPLATLVSAATDGVALVLADGPLEALASVRLALTDGAGRLLTELRLPDAPRGDASAALAAAPPSLGLAVLLAPEAAPLLGGPTLPLGWLTGWGAALPFASGEALAAPTGEALAWLPDGGTLAAALVLRPDGGLCAAAADGVRPLSADGGALVHARLSEAPALLLFDTPAGLRRLAPRAASEAALAATLHRVAPQLAPDADVLDRIAAARMAANPVTRGDGCGTPVLLLAGAVDEFARRLLFLAARDLAHHFAEILLVGPDMRAEAAWLAARLPLPVRAAPAPAEAARRTALARATLVPAGPAALAEALAKGDAAALRARAVPGAALLALAATDDETVVLRLAGEAA